MSTDPAGLAIHRFGFGARDGRLPGHAPADLLAGPDLMAAQIPLGLPPDAMGIALARRREERQANSLPDAEKKSIRRAIRRAARSETLQSLRVALARATEAEDYFRERLVRFWADHFTVGWKLRLEMPVIADFTETAIRPHLTGRFADLLKVAILHPMMLRYLDQNSSLGPGSAAGRAGGQGVNENLGRELLELHTLGVGADYSQSDVRQAALLLTGLTLSREGETVFQANRAEPGAERVLGRSYGSAGQAAVSDIEALLEDLAQHPATAAHIARKLAVHFLSDTPPEDLVTHLTGVFQDTGGDLLALSQALTRHPAAADPTLHKARQPFDFIAAALRALNIGAEQIFAWNTHRLTLAAVTPLSAMGQPWVTPGGPDGWEEGFDSWITPQGLATRIDWGLSIAPLLRRDLPDARSLARTALPGPDTEDLAALVARAETNAEGVALVLASPQFNRR
ncbi:DUF1800 domain-containing protein [Falsigemmobacter faecalis]|uniref:DUF1800 domain-containing protein n=1 Tax=Falsigemmobacter faecalis TaxID=2488730 RepID=A0A3P3D494_9RHOB|nr:DUF1800 domain-containing protein [Falsigemmobacter faecalis]RRH69240.1 DUF1800 domain-containing protein [Falsigemmobacter faecalis]